MWLPSYPSRPLVVYPDPSQLISLPPTPTIYVDSLQGCSGFHRDRSLFRTGRVSLIKHSGLRRNIEFSGAPVDVLLISEIAHVRIA